MAIDNGSFFSSREFVNAWCGSFEGKYEPFSITVDGSGPKRTMNMLKAVGSYGSFSLTSGADNDLCLSPGWNGPLERSTVRSILRQMKTVRVRSFTWGVRFDQQALAEVLNNERLNHYPAKIQVIDLEPQHDLVFSRHNATIRNQIRAAHRRGIQIRSTDIESDIEAYQKIYDAIAGEKGWRFVYPARLTAQLVKFPEVSRFFVAEFEGTVVGGGLFVRDGNSVCYVHGVSDRRASNIFPTSAVIDAGIRWACEIGADFMNLGNSGHNESLARFKSSWGAHFETNTVFKWENPLWSGVRRIRSKTRRLLSGPRQDKKTWTSGPLSWEERSKLDELAAVCDARGSNRKNLLIHGANTFAAEIAIDSIRSSSNENARVVDFGCGTGRMTRYFANRGFLTTGVDITPGMLSAARKFGKSDSASFVQFDGVALPFSDHETDLIWVCSVLKYTLLPPGAPGRRGTEPTVDDLSEFVPTYSAIASEMFRVLKPGGIVVNYELFVRDRFERYTEDFEKAGFVTEMVRVVRRNSGSLERLCEIRESIELSAKLVQSISRLCAGIRFRFDDPNRGDHQFRDYLFIWRKPEH